MSATNNNFNFNFDNATYDLFITVKPKATQPDRYSIILDPESGIRIPAGTPNRMVTVTVRNDISAAGVSKQLSLRLKAQDGSFEETKTIALSKDNAGGQPVSFTVPTAALAPGLHPYDVTATSVDPADGIAVSAALTIEVTAPPPTACASDRVGSYTGTRTCSTGPAPSPGSGPETASVFASATAPDTRIWVKLSSFGSYGDSVQADLDCMNKTLSVPWQLTTFTGPYGEGYGTFDGNKMNLVMVYYNGPDPADYDTCTNVLMK